jgi:hypothetical protein
MHYFLIVLGFVLALGWPSTFVFADRLILKDGTNIQGEVIEEEEDYLKIKTSAGKVEVYSAALIESVKREAAVAKSSPPASAPAAPAANKETREMVSQPDSYPYEQLTKEVEAIFQSDPSASDTSRERPAQWGGPYDAALTSFYNSLYNYVQQYQQAIVHTESSIGWYGNVTEVDPQEAMSGIVQQYRDTLEEFDRTSQIYPDPRSDN